MARPGVPCGVAGHVPAPSSARAHVPGVAVVVALTAAAYVGALVAGTLVSPLVLALVLGVAWRWSTRRGRDLGPLAPGVALAAGPFLKIGIVALGIRLDARLLVELGPALLAGSLLGVAAAFIAVEAVGRAWRVPADLRVLVGIGTAICGASAIVAAAPIWRSRPEHAGASIAAISLVGTLGVLGFVAWDALLVVPITVFGAMAGASLQEVGQVVAAGSVQGPESSDLALLVKLSRVVLLAPVLIAFAWLTPTATQAQGVRRAPRLVPPFVIGFLLLGAAVSAGVVPQEAIEPLSLIGTVLTAAAMAAIGLGIDVRALRGAGSAALALGAVAMVALGATMAIYYTWILP